VAKSVSFQALVDKIVAVPCRRQGRRDLDTGRSKAMRLLAGGPDNVLMRSYLAMRGDLRADCL